MPINEIESHPYLHTCEAIAASRMIVGTFPIYSLTNPRTPRKEQLQQERNDISFFYGSRSNYFWSWYKKYIDALVDVQNPQSIIDSLRMKKISISDVVKSCSRVDESFEDNKLRNKIWNDSLATVIEQSVDKVICTSKSASGAMGWLVEKILIPSGFTVNQNESAQLHLHILNTIAQSNKQVKPVAKVLTKDKRTVKIIALPSPGSPQRRLSNFGYVKDVHSTTDYLNQYLLETFNWFMT